MGNEIVLISKNSQDSPILCYWCDRRAIWRTGTGFLEDGNRACTMHAHLLPEDADVRSTSIR